MALICGTLGTPRAPTPYRRPTQDTSASAVVVIAAIGVMVLLLLAPPAEAKGCETPGTAEMCPLRDDPEGDGVFNEFGVGADIGNVWISRDDGEERFTIDLRVFEEGETPSVCCASESAYMVEFNHTSDITGNRTHYAVAAVRYAGEGYNATGSVFEQYFLYVKPTDSPRWAWCRLQEIEGERTQLDRWGFRYRFTVDNADLDVETPPQRLANLTQQYQDGLFSPYMSCDPPMRGPAAQYGERLTGFGAKYRVNPVGNTEAPDPINHLGEGVDLPGGIDLPDPHDHGIVDSCPYFWPEDARGEPMEDPVTGHRHNPLDDTCQGLPEEAMLPPVFPFPNPVPFVGDRSNGTMRFSIPYVLGAPPPDLKVDAAGTEAAIELGFYHTTAGYPIPVEPLVRDGQEPYECAWDKDMPGTFGEPGLCRTTVVFPEPGWYTIRVNVTDGIDAVGATAGVLVDPPPPAPSRPGTPMHGGGRDDPVHADGLGGEGDGCPAYRHDVCVWDSSGDGIPDRVRHCPVLIHPGCHAPGSGDPVPRPRGLAGHGATAVPDGPAALSADARPSLQATALAWGLGSAAAMLLVVLLGAMLFVLMRDWPGGG